MKEIYYCNKISNKKNIEGFELTPPNSNLVLNTNGPSWNQWVINPTLIPSSVSINSSINAGDISIIPGKNITTPYSLPPKYLFNVNYNLGDLVTFGKNLYINLAWNDARGPAYSASFGVDPSQDSNVWKQVELVTTPFAPMPGWTLVFSHRVDSIEKSQYFKDASEAINISGDPQALIHKFSILNQLEKYRNPMDGTLQFKLVYPDLNPRTNSIEWTQTSNPTGSVAVLNDKPISISPWAKGTTCGSWRGGLGLTSGKTDFSFIQGDGGADCLSYAIGSYNAFNGPFISGPNGIPMKWVQLWVPTPKSLTKIDSSTGTVSGTGTGTELCPKPSGTPVYPIFEVGTIANNPWYRNSAWENNSPPLGNGVMWIWAEPKANSIALGDIKYTIENNFCNTANIQNAIIWGSVDNYGTLYINGTKIVDFSGPIPFTNIKLNSGTNNIKMIAYNAGKGPAGLWLAIKDSTTQNLIFKTDSTWVFNPTSTSVQEIAPKPTTPPPVISNWTYKGCFKDSIPRSLPDRLNNVPTLEACIEQASTKGYTTAGIQYNGECWAGNNSDWNKYGTADNCPLLGATYTQQIYTKSGQTPGQTPGQTTGQTIGQTLGQTISQLLGQPPVVESNIIVRQNCDNSSGWAKPINGTGIKNAGIDFPADSSFMIVKDNSTVILTNGNGISRTITGPTEFDFCSQAGFNDNVKTINIIPRGLVTAEVSTPIVIPTRVSAPVLVSAPVPVPAPIQTQVISPQVGTASPSVVLANAAVAEKPISLASTSSTSTSETILKVNGCENSTVSLNCGTGNVISDGIVYYGKWDNDSCGNLQDHVVSTLKLASPINAGRQDANSLNFDANGNFYFISSKDNKVYKYTFSSGSYTRSIVVDLAGEFSVPSETTGVRCSTYDMSDNAYIIGTDPKLTGNNIKIIKLALLTGTITQIATGLDNWYVAPFSCAIYNDVLYYTRQQGQCLASYNLTTNKYNPTAIPNNYGYLYSDNTGNLYVSGGNGTSLTSQINVYNFNTKQTQVIAGSKTQGTLDGIGEQAQFKLPGNITGDNNGNLYVMDVNNNSIKKINIASKLVTTIAGGTGGNQYYSSSNTGFKDGLGKNALLGFGIGATAITMYNNNLYVEEFLNNSIRVIAPPKSVKSSNKLSVLFGNNVIGQTNPTVSINNNTFGNDPFPGIGKSFEINYSCVPTSSFVRANATVAALPNPLNSVPLTNLTLAQCNSLTSGPYPQQCIDLWWKNAGCTNPELTANYPSDGWWNKQTPNSINADMKQWATLPDDIHVTKCYGARTAVAEKPNPLNFVKSVRIDGGSDYLNFSQIVVIDVNGKNVALNRPTISSGAGWGSSEKNVVDGTLNVRSSPNIFDSANPGGFFEVILDNPTMIASVTIYNRDIFQNRLTSGYKVILKDVNGNGIFTSNTLNSNPQQTVNIPSLSPAPAPSPSPPNPLLNVKSVRIDGGSDWLNFSQLVVTDIQGNNIAVGRPTLSSGVAFSTKESTAVDGALSDRDYAGGVGIYHSSTPTNAFFEVTLDKPTQIASVSIYNRKDGGQSRLASYKVILKDSAGNPIYTSNNLNGNPQQTINIPASSAIKEKFESTGFFEGISYTYILLFILVAIIIIYLLNY